MIRSILFLFFSLPVFLYAQESYEVDSLTINLKTAKQDTTRIKTLLKLSDIFMQTNLEKSLSYADSALLIAKETELLSFQAHSYKKMGAVLFKIGLNDKALENYLMSKKIWEELKDTVHPIFLNKNIGSIYFMESDYGNALKYYTETLGACNEMLAGGDSVYYDQMQLIYNDIGSAYFGSGEKKLALSYYQKAVQSAKKNRDSLILGTIYNNLGKLSRELGDNEKALRYLNLSLENRKKINDKKGMARTYGFLSEFYWSNSDFVKAQTFVEKAIGASEGVGDLRTQRDHYNMLYHINKEIGNADKALDAYVAFVALKDSLFNEASVKEITRLQLQFEFEKLEKERMVKQQRKEMLSSFLIAILVLGLIISSLFYGFLKKRARLIALEKQNLEKDLEVKNKDLDMKNKELTTNVMYLLNKNELITSISKRLQQLKPRLKKENLGYLQRIIFDLQAGADQKVWEEFEYRFQQVHTEFYQKLKEKFPDLTPGEIKLCAFLRLNMTSKDIAAITHQNPKSLEVARARLRKKLNLTKTEVNLYSFLEEL